MSVKATVVHPKLYMVANGKLQHVEKGTELVLSEDQAKKLSSKIEIQKQVKKIDARKSKD
jgi:hypothetical protein